MRTFLGDRNRGTSGTVRATGMRRISPRDTTNLLKSVNAINKNLVSINKLLQNQNKQEVKQQRDQQQEKLRQAENLNKRAAEEDIEKSGAKGVSDTLKRSLAEPAKKIRMGLMSFIKPFLKFFTVVFIGWFSKGVVAWFKQNKEEKKKQIKDAIPKIVSFLTIAGGVLLAINFGIPVITGLIGTMVTVATTAIAALLNPIAFKGLLAAAAVGLGYEAFKNVKNAVVGGSTAGDRVRQTLSEDLNRGDVKEYIEGLEPTASRLVRSGRGSSKSVTDLVKFGENYFVQKDLKELASLERGSLSLQSYGADGKKGEQIEFSAEALKNNKKLLATIPGAIRTQLTDILEVNRLSDAYGKVYKYKDEVRNAENEQRILGLDPSNPDEDKSSPFKMTYDLAEARQNLATARKDLRNVYDLTSPSLRQRLKTDYGITSSNLESDALGGSAIMYEASRLGRHVMGQLQPLIGGVSSQFEVINQKIAGFTESLATMVSEFEFNINVQPVATTDNEESAYIPSGGQGINPFDLENAFIPFAKKTYIILGVG